MKNQKNTTSIFFIGGRSRGLHFLEDMLKQNENIVGAIVMKEDKHEPENYSKNIIQLLEIHSVPFMLSKNVKDTKSYDFIKKPKPSIIIVMGWRTIIPNNIIKIPPLGCVAVHESILPKYRGFAPVNWAIINGEKKTGVTLFYLDDGMDSGDIIAQKVIIISPQDYAQTLYNKTSAASIKLMKRYLPLLKKGLAPRKKQAVQHSSYTCSRVPDDGLISWNDSTKNIYNLIRGLSYPYPGAFTFFNGEKIIINKSSIPIKRKFVGRIPGRVISCVKGQGVEVLTGDGILVIEEILDNSKDKKDPASIISSIKITLGK